MTKTSDYVGGTIGSVPICQTCGSELVVRDAWAIWSPQYGLWELEQVFDDTYCRACEEITTLAWKRQDGGDPRQAIRELNDRFRRDGQGNGSVMVTQGVQALGAETIQRVVMAVRGFDTFSEENDPWGEHDFGAVEVDGEKIFWKIDCYDPSLTKGSEDPANEAITHRVLTIMLAGEY